MSTGIGTVRAVAQSFADALDTNDFRRAARLVAPDCVYEIHGRKFTGPDLIMAEYHKSATALHGTFQNVERENRLTELDSGQATLLFASHLGHKGQSHTFRSCQHLIFGRDGRIRRITHVDLEGEDEKLTQWLSVIGLT